MDGSIHKRCRHIFRFLTPSLHYEQYFIHKKAYFANIDSLLPFEIQMSFMVDLYGLEVMNEGQRPM